MSATELFKLKTKKAQVALTIAETEEHLFNYCLSVDIVVNFAKQIAIGKWFDAEVINKLTGPKIKNNIAGSVISLHLYKTELQALEKQIEAYEVVKKLR